MVAHGLNSTAYAKTIPFLLGSVCPTSVTLYEGKRKGEKSMESCPLTVHSHGEA